MIGLCQLERAQDGEGREGVARHAVRLDMAFDSGIVAIRATEGEAEAGDTPRRRVGEAHADPQPSALLANVGRGHARCISRGASKRSRASRHRTTAPRYEPEGEVKSPLVTSRRRPVPRNSATGKVDCPR